MMTKNRFKIKGKLLFWAVGIIIAINLISFYIKNHIYNVELPYFSYICWTLLFFSILFSGPQMIVRKDKIIIISVLLVDFMLAKLCGNRAFRMGMEDIHIGLIVCLMVLFTMGIHSKVEFTQKDVFIIFRLFVFGGIFCSLYAMKTQLIDWTELLPFARDSFSVTYMSFFNNRNVFAGYCFIASLAASYFFIKKKKKNQW